MGIKGRSVNDIKELPQLRNDEIHFLCIGTDRSTGDSLGPLVGTYLSEMGFENVTGTIEDPCHAMNLGQRYGAIPEGKIIIAIDSCLGSTASVGMVQFGKGPLTPGAGVDKDLGKYGDYSIKGVVNVGGYMEYFVLQNTRLHNVMKMAREIASTLAQLYQPSLQVACADGDTEC